METLLVDLGERSYPIELGWDTLGNLGPYLRHLVSAKNCMVVSNPEVFQLYGSTLVGSLETAGFSTGVFKIPDGEQSKSLGTIAQVYDALVAQDLDRGSPIIALGGGVVGDVAGFAAATFMRGVPFIQVPTTLLAQVDSSVGGKVGVNHREGKNLVGCFYQPRVVWIDLKSLSSLPLRELKAGMAEVAKYGMIQDRVFFDFIEKHHQQIFQLEETILVKIVRHACQIKAQMVGRDEKELGLRALLNYGHTFGHVLETLTEYGTYRHGEAVAIGMVAATQVALELGICKDKSVLEGQLKLLSLLGLPTKWPSWLETGRVLELMMHDKKVRSGALRLVLPVKIGEMTIIRLEPEELRRVLSCL